MNAGFVGPCSGFTSVRAHHPHLGLLQVQHFVSGAALQQHVTYVTDCLGRVQTFRANVYAVHDPAAAEYAERVIQRSQTLGRLGVTAVWLGADCGTVKPRA